MLKNIAFALVTIVLILVAAEAAIRIAGLKPRVDNPFFMLVRVFEYPDYFAKDEDLFWRLRADVGPEEQFLVAGSYRTNSLGLRGPQIDLEAVRQRQRVACFGNSCTFGWKLTEAETYPTVLQGQLEQHLGTGRVITFNCGVPGYSSYQGLKMLREYQPLLEPDVAVICYGWNDHWAAAFDIEDKNQQSADQLLLDIQNLLSRSYLYRAVKYLLLAKYEGQQEYTFNRESPSYRVSVADYRANLIDMARFCRGHRITPILLTAPLGDPDPNRDQPYETYHKLYNQLVREVAKEYRIPLLDAAAAFADRPEFFDNPEIDYIHYNAQGAKWIATRLAELILSTLSRST
jgi:lysophospholipase L1-like esterase